MSLDFDYSKCEGPIWNPDDDNEFNNTLRTIIYYTMPLGMPGYDNKTLDEFLLRMRVYDRMFGTLRRKFQEGTDNVVDSPITIPELRDYAGIKTNATRLTTNAWRKNLFMRLQQEVNRSLTHEKEAL